MSKIIGALFIIAGNIAVIMMQLRNKRQELSLLQSLISALHTTESSIRWKGQTVPECFSELQTREFCGKYFKNILIMLQGKIPLQTAWNKAFQEIENGIGNIMLQMDWDGDETHLLGNLQYVLHGLSSLYDDRINNKRSENRLMIAAIGSGAGLLVIILL